MRAILVSTVLAVCAAAQSPSEPPPLLQIVRIPSGSKMPRPYADAKAAIDAIGLTAITGVPETWLVETHENFASIEDLNNALRPVMPSTPANQYGESQDELLGSPRIMIAAYQPHLGYRPTEARRAFSKARYFRISIYRMRPGNDSQFKSIADQRRLEYDRANLDRPELVYRVISGGMAGIFIVLAPLTSLKQIDDGMAQLPAYLDAMAGADSLIGNGVDAWMIGREHLIFRIDPRISYVSAAFAGEDSAFWQPQR